MASPDAIIASYKASARVGPTMGPQGSAPGIGQISPLAAQLSNERGYANTYGPFLPRDPRTFTQGAFGPFSPVMPVPVDEPADGATMPDARLYEYMVGWNLPVGQPGTEGIKLADYGTLKTLADLYSVARACIELRKNEIAGLDWDIVPTADAAKAYNNSPRLMRDFGERRGKVRKFFEKPDPDYLTFTDFMLAALEDVFVFDAFSLLLRPKRGYKAGLGRGLLGTELDCIELISGPTIRPLVGMHGEKPRPPAPAYQQYLYGVARSDYMQLINQRDLEENGMLGAEINAWSADQFIYRPLVPRRWTPYGFPPVERALIPVMSGLQKQAYQLDFFKEGTIPAVYVSPGDVNMTPNQIRELQTALNAFAGDPAWHHKVIVLPPGSKVDPQKPVDVADQFDDIVMTQVCQAFDVNPMEIGVLPKVSAAATPSAVKQFAQAGANIHERLSTKPTLKWLCDIFDAILHDVLHQEDMRFTFEGLQEDAEQGQLTQLLVEQVQNGLRSVDEAREQLELQPWGLPMTGEPVFFSAAGPMPFTQPALPAATPGQAQGGQQDSRNRSVSRRAPTPGPAPLQQAGRAGAAAQPTPGHAAARGALQGARATLGGTPGPSARGSVTSSKNMAPPAAVKSELAALARHLNKGRRIGTWVPRHLTPDNISQVEAELSKGFSAEEAVANTQTVILGKGDYEWLPKASPAQTVLWTEISSEFSGELTTAFDQSIDEFANLLHLWWTGQLTVTRQVLLDSFSEILYRRLWPVLRRLWAEAWRAYDETAGGYFEAWVASEGRDTLENIVTSRMKQVARLIVQARHEDAGAEWVIERLRDALDVDNRALMIAVTEAGSAGNSAAMRAFIAEQVAYKVWVTRRDGKVCAMCRLAESEGPVSVNALFANGFAGPPAHPNCRCHLEPAEVDTGIMGEDVQKAHPHYTPEEVNLRPMLGQATSCEMCAMWTRTGKTVHGRCDFGFPADEDQTCDKFEPAGYQKDDSSELHGNEQSVWCSRKTCKEPHHGEFGAAGILVRNEGEDGKTRYLLQRRSPGEDTGAGTWGIPGGALLEGEVPLEGAWREAQEEMGPFPPQVTVHHCVTDDHGPSSYDQAGERSTDRDWKFSTFVCDSPDMFTPSMQDAETPDESSGWAWLAKDEVRPSDLHPGLRHGWKTVTGSDTDTTISKRRKVRRVDLSGQQFYTRPDESNVNAPGGGGPLPLSHDEDGIWQQQPDDYHAGSAAPTETGASAGLNDDFGGQRARTENVQQPGDAPDKNQDDTEYVPRDVPPSKGKIPQGYMGGHWPQGGRQTTQPPAGTVGGGLRGTAPTVQSDKPLKRPKTRKGEPPMRALPHEPVTENHADEVYAQLEGNFPDEAIQWVRHCFWEGPVQIPLDEIDFRDHKEWSAWREPGAVEHKKDQIMSGDPGLNPPVLIRSPKQKALIIIDGHHRSLGYQELGLPVTGYIGTCPEHLVPVALQTHSSQEHQGASSENG